jgi:hypothetical protein
MWRWVTRGLVVLTFVALLAPAMLAQQTFTGDVDSPDPEKTHSGLVLVRGWVLDMNQVSKIELLVDDQYQHDALMFLPRIDVVEALPDWPGIHNSRPGFVTGFLASRFSNGPHTVEIRTTNSQGQVNYLGRRTININNSINQAPFGFLDVPGPDGITNVSGSFPVMGWAADADGIERIEVLIDDGIMQGAMYGDPRPDVAATFPDFSAAMFSGYVANIDTTRVQNGVHLLTVRAVDRNGVSTMIGRRTVQIINNDNFLRPFGYIDEPQRDAVLYGTSCGENDGGGVIISPPVRPTEHVTAVRGWALDLGVRGNTGRVMYAELLIDGVSWLDTNDCGAVEGRFANCYGLPRFDVARYYPTFPDSPRAGFLFTLDVGYLMELGVSPGHHVLSVQVGDRDGTFATLPNEDGIPVFFQCVDDDFDFLALGYIEYPQSFDYVGGEVLFRGWALEDVNNVVNVEILIDGNFVGLAQYGFPRRDVGDSYPHLENADNSGWVFRMDTRKLTNARHRLTVRVVDSQGHGSEIGSVDFYLTNGPNP